MSLPNLLPPAQQELAEAIDWYEACRPGLGIELLGAVDSALREIGEAPERYPSWHQNPRFRRFVLGRFPYFLLFHVRDTGPEVVALAHAKRRPGYWLRRLVGQP